MTASTIRRDPQAPRTRRFVLHQPAWQRVGNGWGVRAAGWMGAGMHWLLGDRARGKPGILVYHRIAPRISGVAKPLLNVTPQRFRQQLAGLLAQGFSFWPLGKLLEAHAAGVPVPARTVVVTFDDGFATTWLYAAAVLRELGVPATVFLATGYLDSGGPFPFDAWGKAWRDRAPLESYRPLTTDECRRLAEGGLVELGAHTHTHEDFRGRPEVFQQDLEQCVSVMASRFQAERPAFAFPYGNPHLGFSDEALAAAARRTGARCGLTSEPVLVELKADPFTWGRFSVTPWDTGATLAAKLAGWYTWASRLKRRLVLRKRALRAPSREPSTVPAPGCAACQPAASLGPPCVCVDAQEVPR